MADPNTQATKQPDTETETKSQPGSLPALPALPAVGDGEARTLEVGGAALRLDHMGPMVVNEDGTLSRIANWDKMAEIEQTNALRILGIRNQKRLEKLRAAQSGAGKKEDKVEEGEKKE